MKTNLKPRSNRLSLEEYRKLRLEVLERDGWRCQRCGSTKNLQVHHIEFRSHSGPDLQENLVTLCVACHRTIHERKGAHKDILAADNQFAPRGRDA